VCVCVCVFVCVCCVRVCTNIRVYVCAYGYTTKSNGAGKKIHRYEY
jgi:hypothetical protein